MTTTKLYKVYSPEGKLIQVEGPEGATDEEVIVQAKRLTGVPAPAPLGKRILDTVEPTVEMLGTYGGGALGTVAGTVASPTVVVNPVTGMLVGAGLGTAISKGTMRTARSLMGYEQPNDFKTGMMLAGQDAVIGATTETVGQKVIGPLLSKGAKYVNQLLNVKPNVYLNATDDASKTKRDQILNALKAADGGQIVPGSSPNAGEVAAGAGSVKFSELQNQALRNPKAADLYAEQSMQNAKARLEQEGRVGSKLDNIITKIKAKLDTRLTPVPPEDIGKGLTSIAEAEKTAIKNTVIAPAYKKAFNEAGDAKIDLTNIVGKAEQILGQKLSTLDPSTAPTVVGKLLMFQPKMSKDVPVGSGKISGKMTATKQVIDEPPVATLFQADEMRKAINADIASARVSTDPARATTLRNLGQLHDAIDEAVTKSAIPDAAKKSYKEALSIYRDQYVPRFKTGVNDDLFRTTSNNVDKIKPEDVLTKYFQPKGVSEAENFLTLFKTNPDAAKLLKSGVEDLYLRKTGGDTSLKAYDSFMREYSDPIRVLRKAGIDLTPNITKAAQDGARLDRLANYSKTISNNLKPVQTEGSNSLVIQKNIDELTKGMNKQQLTEVNAVRRDLARQDEFQRLVKMSGTQPQLEGAASEAGKKAGAPLPNFLQLGVTVFNNVYNRLAGKMNEKIAFEIAKEMTSPQLAAKAIEEAIGKRTASQLSQQNARTVGEALTRSTISYTDN